VKIGLTRLLKKSSMTSSRLENISPSSANGFGILNPSSPFAWRTVVGEGFCSSIGVGANADDKAIAAATKMRLNVEEEEGMVNDLPRRKAVVD